MDTRRVRTEGAELKRAEQVITVRRLKVEDMETVARTCFPDDDYDVIYERLQDDLRTQEAGLSWTLVAECEGAASPRGPICGTMKIDRHKQVGWIHNVAVRPDQRGRGIVQAMFTQAEQDCRKAGITRMALHVRRDNPTAMRAYEKAGFHFAYVDGMRGDQLRFEKELE